MSCLLPAKLVTLASTSETAVIFMDIFKRVFKSLGQKGPVNTAKIAMSWFADQLFDVRFGTDTRRWVPREKLDGSSANLADSQPYKATRSGPFYELIRKIDLPREANFIDIGSGKGRVVMIASLLGFKRVIGIDFSSSLCAVARRNIELFKLKRPGAAPMQIVEGDVMEHAFGPDDRVFFMYNPFHEPVMRGMLKNLSYSVEKFPRRIILIYNDPQLHDVVIESGLFKKFEDHWIGGTEFRVYYS